MLGPLCWDYAVIAWLGGLTEPASIKLNIPGAVAVLGGRWKRLAPDDHSFERA